MNIRMLSMQQMFLRRGVLISQKPEQAIRFVLLTVCPEPLPLHKTMTLLAPMKGLSWYVTVNSRGRIQKLYRQKFGPFSKPGLHKDPD